MSTDEVARLCKALSLTDKEGPVRPLEVDLKEDGGEEVGFSSGEEDWLYWFSKNRLARVTSEQCSSTGWLYGSKFITLTLPWEYDWQRRDGNRFGETRSTPDGLGLGPPVSTEIPIPIQVVSGAHLEHVGIRDDVATIEKQKIVLAREDLPEPIPKKKAEIQSSKSKLVKGSVHGKESTQGPTKTLSSPSVENCDEVCLKQTSVRPASKAVLGLNVEEMELDAGLPTNNEKDRINETCLGNPVGPKTGKWKRWARDGVQNDFRPDEGSSPSLGCRSMDYD
ncbi:hypothetical protein EZV62_023567 [Acer yangbiense]|uniref:Uncharacterized protein n=1 Tax=Acer yangbiense TaxID=1000413 RepID=A0A5C7H242_9ROSI|nr:hypothetical protein EZV62_023567 [Acer yangbiense]